ncbi:MAG: hypothetical protein Q7J16_03245 [Candidatus Cloacimonadales bacterium]|nr:hypothetical protein [Candidatus Cloacimonadales bacterium]
MRNYLSLFIIVLLFAACTQRHPTQTNNPAENFFVSAFEGEKTEIENSNEYTYKQTVSWDLLKEGEPLFAYRITTTNEELPEEIFTDENGWVYHYLPGADESIPLSLSSAEKMIWTDQKTFEITFQSVMSELTHIISEVEVKYLLDDLESESISTSFFDNREIGTCLTNSAGDCAGEVIGIGTTFLLNEEIFDIFVEGFYAHHFMYRVNIVAEADSSMIQEGEWMNTINCPNIRIVELSPQNNNALIPNETGEITQFEAYVVTLSGYANSDNPSKLHFKVQDGFYPNTLIYNSIEQSGVDNANAVFALGENHFTTYFDEAFGYELPNEMVNNELHVATAYWIDQYGNNTFIGSDDFRIYLQYGWNGKYNGNYPFGSQLNQVLDEQTGVHYFSTIEYMDLRLDDQPLEYAGLPPEQYNITDDDGTVWLRVPITHEASSKLSLENLDFGEHTFTARAVDLQMAVDETPSNFTFSIFEPVPAEEKDGILILDCSPQSNLFSPEQYVDDFYFEIFSDYSGNVDCLDYYELRNSVWNSMLHFSKDVFSPTDLQQYKLILFHADSANDQNKLALEYDILNIYLEQGGNLIVSSGRNLMNAYFDCCTYGFPLLEKYFGISLDGDAIGTVMFEEFNASWLSLQFFDRAITSNLYSDDIQLMLPSFNYLVTNSDGLGPIALFLDFDADTEPIFGNGVKTPQAGTNFEVWDDIDDDDEFPSLNQYNIYNNVPVGLRKITTDNSCYIFGFPLSYMELEDVQDIMLQILLEIGM